MIDILPVYPVTCQYLLYPTLREKVVRLALANKMNAAREV